MLYPNIFALWNQHKLIVTNSNDHARDSPFKHPLWSLEFVILRNLDYDNIKVSNLFEVEVYKYRSATIAVR